ncbi:MAG: DUF3500 domain-containing protein [Verrucomicrobiae bacterium]|nr:DUF3500 domain-containing protein [Verrucomicrobiae bacterium]
MKLRPAIFALPIIAIGLSLPGQVRAHDAAESMAKAANAWLSTLDAEQKKTATYAINDPGRTNWHFIPKPFEGEGMRKGLTMRDMRQDQRALAFALLNSAMSHDGFSKATTIMSLEQVLWELENHSEKRNPEMYYFSIFGEPGSKAWGWSLEGHHMSLNFTIADGKVTSATPSFFGSNPAEVLEGPRKGTKVLAEEEDLGAAFVKSLDEGQTKQALIADKAPKDVLSEALPEVASLGNDGIPFTALNDDQKKALRGLMDVYVHRLRPEIADQEMAEIEAAGIDKIVFACAGEFEDMKPQYYRIQGPTFLLEYANTQNGANHVHAVWRDFKGDFGRDVLREHFASSPH